jgi:hypothetical protein
MLPMIDAEGTIKLYIDNVFIQFRLPETIISNRGPQFASNIFNGILDAIGVKHRMSTAYHPQTDGQCYNVCPYHPDRVPVPLYVPGVSDSPIAMLLPRASISVPDTCFISPQSAVRSCRRVVDVLFACAIYTCFIVV